MHDAPKRFVDGFRRELCEICKRPLIATALALLFLSLFFTALPGLDLAVTRLFYDPTLGFLDRRTAIVDIVRNTGRLAVWAVALGVTIPLAVKFFFPEFSLPIRPRETLFMLATLALGPGLIVNRILKAFWGRARPRQLAEFGGHASFSPVWWISDQCARNCSFVSGEAAATFWLVAVVYLVPAEWKRPTAAAALALTAAVSLARMAAGGHFLSDVMLAWLIVLLVLLVMERLILKDLPPAFDTAVESRIARGGRALRRFVAGRFGAH